jgi:serine/threonine-protein kinase RsbW
LIVLRVPASLAYRDIATRVVSAACKLVGQGGASQHALAKFQEHVVSAFGEAFNNACIHAYRGLAPGSVTIEVVPEAARIAIRLIDNGHVFDPAAVPAPDLDSLPESGMGIFIIRSFMDEVHYEPGPPNVLSLSKGL